MSDSPGQRLKAERLKRGLSIEDITAATKMRPAIITALEADDYSGFPSITHARNFLSLYGKHLKVNVKDGVSDLVVPARMGIENYQYLNVERYDESTFRIPRRARSAANPPDGEQVTRILLFIAAGIGFIAFAIYLSVNLRRLNLASETSTPAVAVAAPSPVGTPSAPKPGKNPMPSPAPETQAPFYAPVNPSRSLIPKRPWPRF